MKPTADAAWKRCCNPRTPLDSVFTPAPADDDLGAYEHSDELPHYHDRRSELFHLNTLFLRGATVGDRGLPFLKGLTQMGDLWLDRHGLEYLHRMSKLWELHLKGTQVAPAGTQRLTGPCRRSSTSTCDGLPRSQGSRQ